MPKFYRYTIYRLYSWRLNQNDDTPLATVVLLLFGVHGFQIMTVMVLLAKVFPSFVVFFQQRKPIVFLGFLVLLVLYLLIVFNKRRWLEFIEEFKGETSKQRKKRGVLVWLFTTGTVILFFVLLPLLFWNYKG
jgi:hypothetical protein